MISLSALNAAPPAGDDGDNDFLRNQCKCIIKLVQVFDLSNRAELVSALNTLTSDISEFADRHYVLPNKPGPTVLSINQLQGIYTAIEVLWNLEAKHFITARFDLIHIFADLVPWAKSFLLSEKQLSQLCSSYRESVSMVDMNEPPLSFYRSLSDSLMCMVAVVQSHAFTTHMLRRNIRRLLVCYLLLKWDMLGLLERQDAFDGAELDCIKQMLCDADRIINDIASNNVYLTISQLRVLPSSASLTDKKAYAWLRKEVGCMFSALLARPEGNNLELVIKGYLDGVVDGPDSLKLHSIVAATVLRAPGSVDGLSEDGYYRMLLPQIAELMIYGVQNADNVFARLCVLMVQRLAAISYARQPQQGPTSWIRQLLLLLLEPLHALVSPVHLREVKELNTAAGVCLADGSGAASGDGPGSGDGSTVATADQVALCVRLLHALMYICPVTPRLVAALRALDMPLIMIKLGCFVLEHAALYHLKSLVLDFCRLHFNTAVPAQVLPDLQAYALGRGLPFQAGVGFRTRGDGIEIAELPTAMRAGSGVSEFMQLLKGVEGGVSLSAQGVQHAADGESETADLLRMLQVQGLSADGDGEDGGLSSALLSTYQRSSALADLLLQCVDLEATATGKSRRGGTEVLGSGVLPAELFMAVLRGYLGGHPERGGDAEVSSGRMTCGFVLVCLKDKFPMHALLHSGLQIIQLICVFLDGFVARWVADPSTAGEALAASEDSEEQVETLSTILSLLSSIVVLGAKDRPQEEEQSLRACLPALHQVAAIRAVRDVPTQSGGSEEDGKAGSATQKSLTALVETAVDVALMIMTRGGVPVGDGAAAAAPPVEISGASYEDALWECRDKYLVSDDPSLRAYGVSVVSIRLREVLAALDSAGAEPPAPVRGAGRRLVQVVGEEDEETPAPATASTAARSMKEDVLELTVDVLLTHALLDAESFVFLAAVHSLWRLGDFNRRIVVDKLLFYLQLEEARIVACVGAQYVPSCKNKMLIIETLSRVVRRAGAAAPVYIAQVLPTALRLAVTVRSDMDRALGASGAAAGATSNSSVVATAHVDVLSRMKVVAVNAAPGDTSSGSISEQVNATPAAQRAVEALIRGAELILLRQSVLSLIAECLAVSGYSAGRYIVDVVGLMCGILQFEQPRPGDSAELTQAHVSARRTAAFSLRYIVNGLEQKLFQNLSLDGDQLRQIYEALKLAAADRQDNVTKFHGEVGLSVLAQNIQLKLFPQVGMNACR